MRENGKNFKKLSVEIKKVSVKATSSCVKNIEKRPEKRFTHTLDFHGKNHCHITYQLPKTRTPTNFFVFTSQTYQHQISKTCKLPALKSSTYQLFRFHKPTNWKSQKPANYQLFSRNQEGDRPPLDSHLSQPWSPLQTPTPRSAFGKSELVI